MSERKQLTSEKFSSNKSLTPKELAKHLRQPDGEMGKQVGVEMNKGNKHICLNSYKVLNPKPGNHILEIGMGNGFFVKDLLEMSESLSYTGVDYSSVMIEEASILNNEFLHAGVANFKCASIEALPAEDNSFDCITTTNTIYFWPQIENNTKELLRVLKPNGKLVIAYRSKEFMDQIELSKYGFTKYDMLEVEGLLRNSGFAEVITEVIEEPELEFDGKVLKMEGIYTSALKR